MDAMWRILYIPVEVKFGAARSFDSLFGLYCLGELTEQFSLIADGYIIIHTELKEYEIILRNFGEHGWVRFQLPESMRENERACTLELQKASWRFTVEVSAKYSVIQYIR